MASKTEIANLALSSVGVAKDISNLDTENSNEARACKRFFEHANKRAQREFFWPFGKRIAALNLVEADPNTEWKYSYRMPSNSTRFRRILSGTRNDSRQSRVPYQIAGDDQGLLIFTDIQNAFAEYSVYVENTEIYQDDYVLALSLLLGSYIAPRVCGADPFKMGDKAFQRYEIEISKARANAINEEQIDEDPESEFIRGRD